MLVCDDEPQILRALRVVLRDAGFEVIPATTAAEALDAAALRAPDAAILDLLLPDGDGIEVTRRLREWSAHADHRPVGGRRGGARRSARCEAGADDYVTKPFSPRELVARLHAVLRRARPVADEPVLRAGEHRARSRGAGGPARRCRRAPDADRVPPAHGAHDAAAGGCSRTRALLTEVWGPAYADDVATLRTHIANLRRKIEPDDPARRHIRTDAGIGYRFADRPVLTTS